MIQLLAAAFCLFLFTGCLAQAVTHPLLKDTLIPVADTLPYRVILELDDNSASFQARQIHFVEKASGDTVNTFDVRGNNPIPLEKVRPLRGEEAPKLGWEFYEVPDEFMEELSPLYRSNDVFNKLDNTRDEPTVSAFFIRTWVALPAETNSKNTLIFYQTVAFSKPLAPISSNEPPGRCGGRTHIVVLGPSGRLINVFKGFPKNVFNQGYALTMNGHILGCISGIDESDDDFYYAPYEWHLIDLINNRVLFSKETKYYSSFLSGRLGRVFMKGKLVLCEGGCDSTESISGRYFYNFQVMDLEKRISYRGECYLAHMYDKGENPYGPVIWVNDGCIERDYTGRGPDRFLRYDGDKFDCIPLELK